MTQKFTIDFDFPSADETISKQEENAIIEKITEIIKNLKLKPVIQCRFEFFWAEKNKTKSKALICGKARNYIIKALVEAGIVRSDGWDHIVNWTDHFYVIKEKSDNLPGVTIIMQDVVIEFNHLINSKSSDIIRWNINDLDSTGEYTTPTNDEDE